MWGWARGDPSGAWRPRRSDARRAAANVRHDNAAHVVSEPLSPPPPTQRELPLSLCLMKQPLARPNASRVKVSACPIKGKTKRAARENGAHALEPHCPEHFVCGISVSRVINKINRHRTRRPHGRNGGAVAKESKRSVVNCKILLCRGRVPGLYSLAGVGTIKVQCLSPSVPFRRLRAVGHRLPDLVLVQALHL